MRRRSLFALACLAFAALGCNSSSYGGGPTAPTPTAMIQGIWTGTATSVSATGTCLASDFQPIPVAVRWQFTQNGTSFTGQETINNALTCAFRGTVSGNTVTFFADPNGGGSASCTTQTLFCSATPGRPLRLDLHTDQALLTTTVSGTQMSGSGTSSWAVTDVTSGTAVGTYQVMGTMSLQKQ